MPVIVSSLLPLSLNAKHRDRRISTNSGQGAGKAGLDQSEHAVIYTGNEPANLPTETKITKKAIQVILVDEEQKFDPRSRVNFGMTHPVQHNVKVLRVGKIADRDHRRFMGYYQNELEKDLGK